MPLYRPKELMEFLTSLGVVAKRSMSQNFLIDGNVVKKTADISTIVAGDVVLEIGPGPGVLTEELLNRGATVIAIEKDNTFAEALPRLQTSDNRLHVITGDALSVDISSTLAPHLSEGKKGKVVASLPYSITTPLLQKLIGSFTLFSAASLIVQDDVARKATSHPGDTTYSYLAAFLENYSKAHYAFTIGRNSFSPAPKVASALLSLSFRDESLLSDKELATVRAAFSQRRKMLRASLKEFYSSDAIMNALVSIKKPTTARPEELTIEDFAALFCALA